MPVHVVLGRMEIEAAKAADLTLEGSTLIYSPADTMELCAKIEATGVEGASRLVTRLADIYGKHFVRNQAPTPAPKTKRRALLRDPPIIEDDPGPATESEDRKDAEPGAQPDSLEHTEGNDTQPPPSDP